MHEVRDFTQPVHGDNAAIQKEYLQGFILIRLRVNGIVLPERHHHQTTLISSPTNTILEIIAFYVSVDVLLLVR